MLVSPSLLAADFCRLDKEIEMINQSNADWLHLDIMDGVFVPNISFGFSVLESIAPICKKPMDVHLMIVQPEKFISRLAKLGTYMMTVHYEACPHLDHVIREIRDAGMKVGVAINPSTPYSALESIISDVDMVLIMTVNPGYGGQPFIEYSYKKIEKLREMMAQSGAMPIVQIDGGVNADTAPKAAAVGVDCLVAGSYVFGAQDPMARIDYLKGL